MPVPDIRRLSLADLDRCTRLSQDRGWPPETRKWRLLLEAGDGYGIDDNDGSLAGAVICTRYGDRLAAVGMMLVAHRHGRRGLGSALMRHVLDHTRVRTIALTATGYGRPVYERLGFRTVGTVTKYTGVPAELPPAVRSRPYRPSDLPGIVAADAGVFGADRSALLARLPAFADRLRVIDGPDGITGFGAAWSNDDDTVVGPTVAAGLEDALDLIGGVTGGGTGGVTGGAAGPIRLDLDDRRLELIAWALRQGLIPGDATAHMVHGDELPGDRTRLFTPVTVALG